MIDQWNGILYLVVVESYVYYCIPRTKYVRGILWFSRRYAAAAPLYPPYEVRTGDTMV